MSRNPSHRTYERRYREASRLIARQAAEAEARIALRNRIAEAATICPDTDCPEPRCVAARAAIMRGEGWRAALAILHPAPEAPRTLSTEATR